MVRFDLWPFLQGRLKGSNVKSSLNANFSQIKQAAHYKYIDLNVCLDSTSEPLCQDELKGSKV